MWFIAESAAILLAGALTVAKAPARAEASDETIDADLAVLKKRRIYFGHQSVGNNLLDGIRDITAEATTRLVVREITKPSEVQPGTLAHAPVGENGKPLLKLASFEAALRAGIGDTVDIAMMKFCYADFNAQTDAVALFRQYRDTFENLEARYPRVRFVHVTVPLTARPQGPKAWLKTVLGRSSSVQDNVAREHFNELLRAAYQGKKPVFDLAAAESRWPDGRIEAVAWGGTNVPALVPAYTDDGAHLNATAQRLIGREMLRTLAKVR